MDMEYDHSVSVIGGLLIALQTYQGALRDKGYVKLTAGFQGEEVGSVVVDGGSFGMSTSKGKVEVTDNIALSRLVTALIGSEGSVCVSVSGQVKWPDASNFKFDLTIPLKRNSTGGGNTDTSTDTSTVDDAGDSDFDIMKYINTDDVVKYWDSASAAQPIVQVTVTNPLPIELKVYDFSFDLLLEEGNSAWCCKLAPANY
jgi:hypothetical protein